MTDTREWYFTFGHGQHHPETGEHLVNRYVRITGTYQGARAEMFRLFGTRWAAQYATGAEAGVGQFGLTELPLPDHPLVVPTPLNTSPDEGAEHQYLIWSNEHRGWWRQNRRGYTHVIQWAGVFDEREALKIIEGNSYGGGITAHDNLGYYDDQTVPDAVLVPLTVEGHPGGPGCPPAPPIRLIIVGGGE